MPLSGYYNFDKILTWLFPIRTLLVLYILNLMRPLHIIIRYQDFALGLEKILP